MGDSAQIHRQASVLAKTATVNPLTETARVLVFGGCPRAGEEEIHSSSLPSFRTLRGPLVCQLTFATFPSHSVFVSARSEVLGTLLYFWSTPRHSHHALLTAHHYSTVYHLWSSTHLLLRCLSTIRAAQCSE